MNTYKITADNTGQLPTEQDIKSFFAFMKKEYPEYVDVEKREVQAHDEGDLGWFIGEFIKFKKSIKRFYWKWSVLYEAYAVYDTKRKSPEGNDYLIATSDDLNYTSCEELCNGLNENDSYLFEKYGIDTCPVS